MGHACMVFGISISGYTEEYTNHLLTLCLSLSLSLPPSLPPSPRLHKLERCALSTEMQEYGVIFRYIPHTQLQHSHQVYLGTVSNRQCVHRYIYLALVRAKCTLLFILVICWILPLSPVKVLLGVVVHEIA